MAIAGPTTGAVGQQLQFVGSIFDPGPDVHITQWEVFDGNGTKVGAANGAVFPFIPATAGTFTVVFAAADKQGGVGTTSLVLTVAPPAVVLQPDDCDPTKTMLVVTGTAGNDSIQVTPAGNGGLAVTINGVAQGVFAPTGRVVVNGLAGDDLIEVADGVAAPAWLYGGDGNDSLRGGAGNDVLLGGAGTDDLRGGAGRDLLIGGLGADCLKGNDGDGILIAGFTAFDDTPAALCAVMAEWTRADRGYSARVEHLRDGGGLNGSIRLTTDGPGATVHDDGAADTLQGDAGRDWFFANLRRRAGSARRHRFDRTGR